MTGAAQQGDVLSTRVVRPMQRLESQPSQHVLTYRCAQHQLVEAGDING
jgi:hypothetical protein